MNYLERIPAFLDLFQLNPANAPGTGTQGYNMFIGGTFNSLF